MTKPATSIAIKDTKKVSNKLTELCDREGFQIDNSTENAVTCSRQSGVMAEVLYGTKYGTDVHSYIHFNVFSLNKNTKVIGNAWFGNQTAFGQNRQNEIQGGDAQAILQRIMDSAKSELEVK